MNIFKLLTILLLLHLILYVHLSVNIFKENILSMYQDMTTKDYDDHSSQKTLV